MIQTIQFKRGNIANLPTLALGEPALTTDTGELYIGGQLGNIKITGSEQLLEIQQYLGVIPTDGGVF